MDKPVQIKLRESDRGKAQHLLELLRSELEERAEQDEHEGESAAFLLVAFQEDTEEHHADAVLLLAVRSFLQQHGLNLEPNMEFTGASVHLVLDGVVSVRLLVDGPPYLLEGYEQDEGFTYDAYACLAHSGSKSYEMQGFMLHEDVRDLPGSAGSVYAAPVVEVEPALSRLLAIAAARQVGPSIDFAQDDHTSREADVMLEQVLTEHEDSWVQIQQLVYENTGQPAEFPPGLQAALDKSPALARRYRHLLEFVQMLRELPASAYEQAIQRADSMRAQLAERIKELQTIDESETVWEPLLQARGKQQTSTLYTTNSFSTARHSFFAGGQIRLQLAVAQTRGISKSTGYLHSRFERVISEPLAATLACEAIISEDIEGQVTRGPVVNLVIKCDQPEVLSRLTVIGTNPETGEYGELAADPNSRDANAEPISVAWLAAEGEIEILLEHEGQQFLVSRHKLSGEDS